ncbi:MAG TPA: sulfotransferase [Thermopolyspora sp.]|jgi:Sulfotransferase domain.
MTSDRPIFVIGCPRSGTTLLQLMLHSHPHIAVPPETRFLVPAYFHRKVYGDMRLPDNRRRLAEWIATGPNTKFGELGLDAAEFIEAATAGPGSFGSVIGTVFRSYAARFAKLRWGDKRPSYFQHVKMIRRLFPDAQFVHLIRDGRDCVASLKEMPWYTLGTYHAIANWADAIDIGRRHGSALPGDAYYELRYEDLTADPERELRKLCRFIGEEYDPTMAEPRHMARVAVPAHKVWHSNTHGDVTRARVGSWSSRLEPWEIDLCETVLGKHLTDNGYELTGAPRAARKHVSAYRAAAAKRHAARWKRDTRDRVSRLREPGPLAALLTSAQVAQVTAR